MAKLIEIRAIALKMLGLAGLFLVLSTAFSADSARQHQSSGFRYSTYLNTLETHSTATAHHGSFIVQTAKTDLFSTTTHHIYEELSDEIQGMPIKNSILGYLIDGKDITYDYQTVWRTRGWNVLERATNRALFSASETARRTGLIRTLELDVQSELGGRSANVGISALGGLRETKDDVVAWQLRGYRTEDDTGANAGLIYRRATESNVLIGANVFIDYETADADNFWRWSVGGELRSPWIDVFANRYEGITDPVVKGGIATYTADGYDIELNVHSPNISWLTGEVTYYNWLGEYGEDDDEGVRFGIRLTPRNIPLVLEIEYEDADEGRDVGGRISYTHEFGAPSARRGSRAEFRAQDWFYAPVEREYTQRIRGDDGVGGYTRRIALASTVPDGFLVIITSDNLSSLSIAITISGISNSNTYIVSGTRDGRITLQPPTLTIITDPTGVTAAVWDIPTEATISLGSNTPLNVSFLNGAITSYIGSTVIMDRDSIGLIDGIIRVVSQEGFSGEFMAFQGSERTSIQNGVIMRSGGEEVTFRDSESSAEITLSSGNPEVIVSGMTLSRSQTSCEAPDANATIGITFRCPIENARFEINSAYANADTSLLNVSQRGNNAALITYLENLSPTSTPHFASVSSISGGSGNDITYSGSTSNLRVDNEGRIFLVDPSTNFPTGVTVVNAAITIVASDIVPEIDPLTTVFQVEVRSNALTPFTANLRGTGRSVPQNGNTETTPIGIRDARNGQLLALASISPGGGVGSIYEYRRLVGGSNSGNNTPINNLNVSSEGVISIPRIDEASGIVLNATLGITVEVRDMADATDHTDNITLILFVRLDEIRTDPLEINFTASDTYESSNGDFRYTASGNRIRVNYPYGGLRSQSGTEAHRTLGTFALAGGSGRTAARLEATAPSGLEASLSSDMKTLMLRLSGASTDTANYTFNISATDPIVSPIDASYEIQAVQDIGGVTDEKQPAIGNIIQGGGGNYRYFTELARRDSRSYPHTGIQLGEAQGGSGSGYSSRLVSGAASGISYNSNTREITFSRLPAEGNYELVIEFSDRDRSLGANSHRVTIAIESTDDLVDVALYLPTDDARANRLNTINTNLGNVSETGRQVAIAELVEVTDGTLTQVSGELIFTANPDGMGGIITLPDDQVGTGVVVLDGDRSVVRHFIVLRARDNELNVQVDISINAELDFDEPVITISENTTYAGGDIRYNLDGGIGGANIRINYPNGGDWSQGVSAAQRQIAVLAGEATFEAGAHSSILESDSTGLRFVSATPPDDTTLPYTVTYEPVNSAIGITGRIVPVTVHGVENIEASGDSIVPAASAYVVGSNLSYRYIVPNVPSGGSRGIAINIGDFSGGSGEYRTRAVNVRTPLRFVDNSGSNALEFNGTFQAGQAYTAIIEISDANSNLGTLPYSVTIVVEAIDVLFEINSAYANADTSILNVVSQDGSIQALITYLENNSPRDDAHFASARVSGGSASGITYSGTSSNLQINANGEISLLDASTNFPPGIATMTAAITIVATDTLLSIPITTVFQVEVRANALTPFTANLSGTGRSIPANSNTETTPLGITDASNGQTLALARINPRGGVGSNYTYTRLVGGSNSGDNEPINNLNVNSEGVISIPIINELSLITLNATLGITVEVSDTADTSTRTPDGHTPNITLILFVRLDNIRTDPLQIDFTASPTYAGTTSDGEFRYTTTGNNIRINYPYNSTRRSQSTSDDHRNLGRVVMSGGSGRTAAQIQSNSILANIDTDIMNDTFLNIRIPDDTNVSTDRWTVQVTASDPVADNITAEYIVQAVRDVGGVTDSKDPAIGNVIQGGSGSYRYFTELASRNGRTYPHTGIQLSDAQGGSGSYSSSLVSGAASGISYNETNREITFASSPAVGNYELVIEFRDGGSLGANPHSVTIAIEATDNLVDVALFAPGDTTGTTRLNIINENLGLVSETGRNVARATLAEVTNGTLTKVDGGLDFTPDASGMGGIIALPDDQVGTGIIDLDRDVVLQSIVFEAIDSDNEVTVTISFIAELSFAEPVITISENSAYAGGDIRYDFNSRVISGGSGEVSGAYIRINYPNNGNWNQGDSDAQRIAILAGESTFEAGAHSSIFQSDNTALRFASSQAAPDTTDAYIVNYEPVNMAIGITGIMVPVTVYAVEDIGATDSIVSAANSYIRGNNGNYRYIVPTARGLPVSGTHPVIQLAGFDGGSGEYTSSASNVSSGLSYNSTNHQLQFTALPTAGTTYSAVIVVSDSNNSLEASAYTTTISIEATEIAVEANIVTGNGDTDVTDGDLTRTLGALTDNAISLAIIDIVDPAIINSRFERVEGSLDFDTTSGIISIPDDQLTDGVIDYEAGVVRHFIVIRAHNEDIADTFSDYRLDLNLSFTQPAVGFEGNSAYNRAASGGEAVHNIRYNYPGGVALRSYEEGGINIRINYANGGAWFRTNNPSDIIQFRITPANGESYRLLDSSGNTFREQRNLQLNAPTNITDVPLQINSNVNDFRNAGIRFNAAPPDDTTTPYVIRVQPHNVNTGIDGFTVTVTIHAVEDVSATDSVVASAAAYLRGSNGNYRYVAINGEDNLHNVVSFVASGGSGDGYTSSAPSMDSGLSYDATNHRLQFTARPTAGTTYSAVIVVSDSNSSLDALPYTTTIAIEATDIAVDAGIFRTDDSSDDDVTNGELTRPLGALTESAVNIAEARLLDTSITNVSFTKVAGGLEFDSSSRIISIPDDQFAGGLIDYDADVVRHFITVRATNDDNGDTNDFVLSVNLSFTQPQVRIIASNFYDFNLPVGHGIRHETIGTRNSGNLYEDRTFAIRINYPNGGNWSRNNDRGNRRVFLSSGDDSGSSYRLLNLDGTTVYNRGVSPIPPFNPSFVPIVFDDISIPFNLNREDEDSYEELTFQSVTPPDDTTGPAIFRFQPYNPMTGLQGLIISLTLYTVEDVGATDAFIPAASSYFIGDGGSYSYVVPIAPAPADGDRPLVVLTPNSGSGEGYTSSASGISDGLRYEESTHQIIMTGAPATGDIFAATIVVVDTDTILEAAPYTTTIMIEAVDTVLNASINDIIGADNITGSTLSLTLSLVAASENIADLATEVTNIITKTGGSLVWDATSNEIRLPATLEDIISDGELDETNRIIRHAITLSVSNVENSFAVEVSLAVEIAYELPTVVFTPNANFEGGDIEFTQLDNTLRINYPNSGNWYQQNTDESRHVGEFVLQRGSGITSSFTATGLTPPNGLVFVDGETLSLSVNPTTPSDTRSAYQFGITYSDTPINIIGETATPPYIVQAVEGLATENRGLHADATGSNGSYSFDRTQFANSEFPFEIAEIEVASGGFNDSAGDVAFSSEVVSMSPHASGFVSYDPTTRRVSIAKGLDSAESYTLTIVFRDTEFGAYPHTTAITIEQTGVGSCDDDEFHPDRRAVYTDSGNRLDATYQAIFNSEFREAAFIDSAGNIQSGSNFIQSLNLDGNYRGYIQGNAGVLSRPGNRLLRLESLVLTGQTTPTDLSLYTNIQYINAGRVSHIAVLSTDTAYYCPGGTFQAGEFILDDNYYAVPLADFDDLARGHLRVNDLSENAVVNNLLEIPFDFSTSSTLVVARLALYSRSEFNVVIESGNLMHNSANGDIYIPAPANTLGGSNDVRVGNSGRVSHEVVLRIRHQNALGSPGQLITLTVVQTYTIEAPNIQVSSNPDYADSGAGIRYDFAESNGNISVRINYRGGIWSKATLPGSTSGTEELFRIRTIPGFEIRYTLNGMVLRAENIDVTTPGGVATNYSIVRFNNTTPGIATTRPYVINIVVRHTSTGTDTLLTATIYAVADITGEISANENFRTSSVDNGITYTLTDDGITYPYHVFNIAPSGGLDIDGSGVDYDIAITQGADRFAIVGNEIRLNSALVVGTTIPLVFVISDTDSGAMPTTLSLSLVGGAPICIASERLHVYSYDAIAQAGANMNNFRGRAAQGGFHPRFRSGDGAGIHGEATGGPGGVFLSGTGGFSQHGDEFGRVPNDLLSSAGEIARRAGPFATAGGEFFNYIGTASGGAVARIGSTRAFLCPEDTLVSGEFFLDSGFRPTTDRNLAVNRGRAIVPGGVSPVDINQVGSSSSNNYVIAVDNARTYPYTIFNIEESAGGVSFGGSPSHVASIGGSSTKFSISGNRVILNSAIPAGTTEILVLVITDSTNSALSATLNINVMGEAAGGACLSAVSRDVYSYDALTGNTEVIDHTTFLANVMRRGNSIIHFRGGNGAGNLVSTTSRLPQILFGNGRNVVEGQEVGVISPSTTSRSLIQSRGGPARTQGGEFFDYIAYSRGNLPLIAKIGGTDGRFTACPSDTLGPNEFFLREDGSNLIHAGTVYDARNTTYYVD